MKTRFIKLSFLAAMIATGSWNCAGTGTSHQEEDKEVHN